MISPNQSLKKKKMEKEPIAKEPRNIIPEEPQNNILNRIREDDPRAAMNVRQQSVNQQYRIDERVEEASPAVGVHAPVIDEIGVRQEEEPEINLYDDADSEELDIVEKSAPEPNLGKHGV